MGTKEHTFPPQVAYVVHCEIWHVFVYLSLPCNYNVNSLLTSIRIQNSLLLYQISFCHIYIRPSNSPIYQNPMSPCHHCMSLQSRRCLLSVLTNTLVTTTTSDTIEISMLDTIITSFTNQVGQIIWTFICVKTFLAT